MNVAVGVRVLVGVLLSVTVDVLLGVNVSVRLGVTVAVLLGVNVGVLVRVGEGVRVGEPGALFIYISSMPSPLPRLRVYCLLVTLFQCSWTPWLVIRMPSFSGS